MIVESMRSGDAPEALGAALQSSMSDVAKLRRRYRMGVGYSPVAGGGYRLELRVQAKGRAEALAQSLQAEWGAVNVEYLPVVEVPLEAPAGQDDDEPLRRLRRPLVIGASVGHADRGTGTLGCFVTPDGARPAMMSCNHVLALLGEAEPGDHVLQPGRVDEPNPRARTHRVARLYEWSELSATETNDADVAVAELNAGVLSLGNVVPGQAGVPEEHAHLLHQPIGFDPHAVDRLRPDSEVYKLGRTTGFTVGRVTARAIDGIVAAATMRDGTRRDYVFDDVLQVECLEPGTPFSKGGDSGSLVFTRRAGVLVAVGLVFAGGLREHDGVTTHVSFACDIRRALERVGATWLEENAGAS
jgi:hypothetical protein